MIIDPLARILKGIKPMSMYEDLGVVIDILSFTKPNSILELGAGSGSWLLAMNYALDHEIKFVGYEDFRLDYNFGWPKTATELTNYMAEKSSSLGKVIDVDIRDEDIYHIDLEYLKNLNIKFDVVRLDCMEQKNKVNEIFYKILPFTSDDCIFLVDDITPNLCPNRFLSYMDKVNDGILKPIWFGIKEGAWCKTAYDSAALQQHIIDSIQDIVAGKSENIFWNNLEHRLIKTSMLLR
jgi:SAM-dependent methyltransferase